MTFTTRPELSGTFGMVASTHWLASSAGMAVLERGGNAFDAAVAAGFALQVVEPHMNGPGGDLPLLLWHDGAPRVLCGQGPAPAAASVSGYRALGLDLVPGTGYLAACVPGSFDAWLTLLRDYGTWELADVLAYAIGYARDGFPMTPGIERAILALEPSWTTSAALWRPAARLRNPLLADTYERLARSGGSTREGRIDAARDAWYRGWVAEAIVEAVRVPARRQLGRGARRCARRRRPGGVLGVLRVAGLVRLPRLDGVQDRAVGPGARVPPAARAARRAGARAVPGRRAPARRARVREARVRGP